MSATSRIIAAVLASILLTGFASAKEAKTEGKVGDLLVTAQSVELTDMRRLPSITSSLSPRAPKKVKAGFHDVRFKILFRNIGKQAVCASIKASLESEFGILSMGTIELKGSQLDMMFATISQLLPSEEVEAQIVFTDQKDGVQPLVLIVAQVGTQQTCNDSHTYRMPSTTKLEVRNIPIQESSQTGALE